MKTDIDLIGDVAIISLKGELDSRGNAHVDRILRDQINKQCYKVILDVSAIRFIGSQTISMLLSNMKDMRAGGGNIKFLNPDRSVMQYLKKNRMIELFEVYTTRSEAIKSFDISFNSHSPKQTASKSPNTDEALKPKINQSDAKIDFDTSGVLYTNSCMLVSLIKLLHQKNVLTAEEARELLDYENMSLKGISE